jgi:TonB family protein
MTKALVLSFLFHSLAFAGSFFLLGNSFLANKISELKGSVISVNMIVSPIKKEELTKAEPALVPKGTVQKTRSLVKNTPLASRMPSVQTDQSTSTAALSNAGNVTGEEGAANLIPHSSNQPPAYPEKARSEGLTGKMMIQLTVDQTGRVIHINVIEGQDNTPQILQDAAISAVKEWRFRYKTTPRERAVLSLPIVFNLED